MSESDPSGYGDSPDTSDDDNATPQNAADGGSTPP